MSDRTRCDGAPGVVRPLVSATGPNGQQEDIAEALAHMARALAAIDRKLTIVIAELDSDSLAVQRVAASLGGKPF